MFVTVTQSGGRRGQPPSAERRGTLSGIRTATASTTLKTTDVGKTVEMNSASSNSLTVPPNSDVPIPVKSYVNWTQIGAGRTTLVAGSGVTIRNRNGLLSGGQYAGGTLYKRGTNEWVALGDLATV